MGTGTKAGQVRTPRQEIPVFSTIAGHVRKRANLLRKGSIPRAASPSTALFSALLLSACVSSPGSFFESVTKDKELANAPAQELPADLTAETVETTALAPISETNPKLEPTPADTSGTGDGDENTSGLDLALRQTDDASLLTTIETPQPLAPARQQQALPQQADLSPALLSPGSAGTPQQSGAADPSQPQQNSNPWWNPLSGGVGANGTGLAYAATTSTGGNLNPDRMVPGTSIEETEGGFSIGSQTIIQPDPFEAAAEVRIANLYPRIDHGRCKTGWGPKPKKIGAKRIQPGHPYYIEIRMRQTPLMPVGHTYVAYGRLGGNGEPLDEHLIMLAPFGGYVGAAIASGVPMPGVLTPHPDDCRIRPDLGYRVSLNAQDYERLLREISSAKNKTPNYLLFANNCNHFMTRIAGSVGIKPPRNKYVPAVRYLHDMIEANEGIKIARGWNPAGWQAFARQK